MNSPKQLNFKEGRKIDLICLGRVAVDFYGEQTGVEPENVSAFSKYLGGSSANIAYGTSLLGLKTAMISRVGDEQMGNFLMQTLQKVGCDTSQIKRDKKRLTGLAILSIRDKDRFPLLFYRKDCADMALSERDINEDFIKDAKSLLITGTHFSTERVYRASVCALEYAKKYSLVRVLDIDYRPVLWGLTGLGEGENRFVADDKVSQHLQKIMHHFDLIIGTEEEWQIAGGFPNDTLSSLKKVREISSAIFIVKRGQQGASIIDGEIPKSFEDTFCFRGYPVEILNVVGAGDAFAAGLMSGLIHTTDWNQSMAKANACGAIVVSRHGCSPAMPCQEELDYFFNQFDANSERTISIETDKTLKRLHHSAPFYLRTDNELFVFAFDHRAQLVDLCKSVGADTQKIKPLKQLFFDAACRIEETLGLQGKFGILCDDILGREVLYQAEGKNWWVGRPIELPKSNPVLFEKGEMLPAEVRKWPRSHVLKILVFYDPEDRESSKINEKQLQTLQQICWTYGHRWILEIIPPLEITEKAKREALLISSLRRLYDLGIMPNMWKLEGMSERSWEQISNLILEKDSHCSGVVILGLNEPIEVLGEFFEKSKKFPVVRGYMVGRSIFNEPSLNWLTGKYNDEQVIEQLIANFKKLHRFWQKNNLGR